MLLSVAVLVHALTPQVDGFMMGVNLGGFLVRENWIFPDEMPVGVDDEWTLIKKMGGPRSSKAIHFMNQHWKSFVTEADLDALKNFGITHVRIPVGWWLIDYCIEDGFVDGGKAHLERVLDQLQERGMGAILDLHALPGAQVAHQSFTGKSEPVPGFFKNPADLARGKDAMMKLADYIKSFEAVPSRRHAVVGIELVNEPDLNCPVEALYAEMVPRVRSVLPSSRYSILLSFMDSPRVSASWLGQKMAVGPKDVWFNVLYDKHLYHAYGDDDGPTPWTVQMDSCKTCCRDSVMIQTLGTVPFVVGEWSLTSGTCNHQEHNEPSFLRSFWTNQLSLWKTSGALGSFFWLHRLVPRKGQPDYFLPFNLLRLIEGPTKLPKPADISLDVLCPGEDRSHCPSFMVATVQGTEQCTWSEQPREPSLFCMSVMTPAEVELTKAQLASKTGIFACDEFSVISGERILLGHTPWGAQWTWFDPELSRAMRNASVNAEVFLRAWDLLIDQKKGGPLAHDWIVKVDPDSVFLADRLRQQLSPHEAPKGSGLYLANCAKNPSSHKLLGSLEVFSHSAFMAYKRGRSRCKQELNWKNMGEDIFMQECFDKLGVGKVDDFGLLGDSRCIGASCNEKTKVVFHPFRTVKSYFDCLHLAKEAA